MLAHKSDAPFKVYGKKRKVPDSLIKETINGVPFYFSGYKNVMNKTKTIEEIMADSTLQFYLKNVLQQFLLRYLDFKKYFVGSGELGAHIDSRNNLSLDFVIYDRTVLTPDKINTKYAEVAPKIVVEIDVKIEFEDNSETAFEAFILPKVQKLFEFGTEKVIWIFSKNKTIVIANSTGDWKVQNWSTDFEIIEGINVNIAQILREFGIDPDQLF